MSAISLPDTNMDRLALCVGDLTPYCDLGLAKTNKYENEALQILVSFVEQWQQPAVSPPFSYCISDRSGQSSLLKCVTPRLVICDGETHFSLMSLQWRIQFPLSSFHKMWVVWSASVICLGHTTSICFLLSLQQLHTAFLSTDQHIWYAFYSKKKFQNFSPKHAYSFSWQVSQLSYQRGTLAAKWSSWILESKFEEAHDGGFQLQANPPLFRCKKRSV